MRTLALLLLLLSAAGAALAEAPYRLGEIGPAPRRVVTLAPSLTDLMIELGMGDRLVGVSRYDERPEVAQLPRVGGFVDPAPEAILALSPDLLLVQPSPGNRGVVERLASLGIPVLVLPLHSIEEVLASTKATGEALGDAVAGRRLAARIEKEIAAVGERTKAKPKRRVLVVFSWSPLVVAGSGSYADELLAAAGGRNLAADSKIPYPTLSAEAALASDPEIVLDASGGHGAGAPLPGWQGRVRKPRSQGLYQPGPSLIEALRELEGLLHPGGEEAQ